MLNLLRGAGEVLLLDECSMLDVEIWSTIVQLCGCVDHTRRPGARGVDEFGSMHLILFGDFKRPLVRTVLFFLYSIINSCI